jgi:uncharacterized protein YbbC (DUF1343 family)
MLLMLAFALHAQPRMTFRTVNTKEIKEGSERTDLYFPLIKDKKVALVVNTTSVIGRRYLADTLLAAGIRIVRIFAPEHGFRISSGAGEKVADGKDPNTGIPIISLYGKNLKPTQAQMTGLEAVIFDIQDVGVRYYTYASTLQYMMEACAVAGIPLILLDRPNPNGFFVDGPVLEKKFASFVGLNPVPLVHGLTLGEYAGMINGEGWLANGKKCDLKVIPMLGYNHSLYYHLPYPPSPNLPNMASVYLYPSLGLFEGTPVSVGRGTSKPFQLIGYPGMTEGIVSFIPTSMPGYSLDPPYKDQECKGIDLTEFGENLVRDFRHVYLFWLIEIYKNYPVKDKFFLPFFDKLAGTASLREMIVAGKTEEEIRASWQADLAAYKKIRKNYLLYPDFE